MKLFADQLPIGRPLDGDDEVAELDREFRKMVEKVQAIVRSEQSS